MNINKLTIQLPGELIKHLETRAKHKGMNAITFLRMLIYQDKQKCKEQNKKQQSNG